MNRWSFEEDRSGGDTGDAEWKIQKVEHDTTTVERMQLRVCIYQNDKLEFGLKWNAIMGVVQLDNPVLCQKVQVTVMEKWQSTIFSNNSIMW